MFLVAINVIIEFVTKDISFEETDNPPMKAFMDDLFLMSSSTDQTQRMLDSCVTALNWSGMSFRAKKSRSMVILKGKVLDLSPFQASIKTEEEIIPSIHTNPVKFLGRTINVSLSDSEVIDKFITEITFDRN